jgi:hypothetical protein
VVIVCQYDSPAVAHRAHHLPDHTFRLSHVFEHEARVSQVKAAPFALLKRELQSISMTPLNQIRFVRLTRLPFGFRELLFVALDPNHAAAWADRPGQIARELS